ncbi:flagellar hook-associated protein FlgL [Paraconexibacter algicola]|uniref:Flagellar hook-associated protein 3 n=1 Tax=Paraconexibacter algicola TaxID=2133960 RepID=A0A2T4UIY4_9ACTN|nr:flagellar hook-associated protein FlgL [Paraconexibacter algicola]PTL59198.1 flagellar hook-associated protein 3 [Paraconexibacter algicola]
MRITHTMLTDRLLGDLRTGKDRIAEAQQQVSTGRRINRPSDDPAGARAAVVQRADLAGLARQKDAVAEANDWTDATDTALGGLADLLHRARELATQGANGSYTQADRERIAGEIDQLVEAAKERANAKVGDRYVLSGTATTTRPYTPGGPDTYGGDTGAVLREIGPGVTVQVNQLGSQILGSGQTPGDGLMLDTLRDVAQHLRGGTTADLAALRGADLQGLQANLDTISTARSANGATAARLASAATSLGDLELAGQTRLDRLEGADMAQAILALSTRQSAYEAALKSGATVIQPSLMDFLR